MSINRIALEYLTTASLLKDRMDELKRLQKSKKFEEQKKIEDRIVLLNAEYCHLLHIAGYLGSYYDKAKPVEKSEVA